MGTLSPVTQEAEGELAQELLIVHAKLSRIDCVLQHDEGAVERERLLQEVVGPEFGGAHSRFNGAVAADDDDLGQVRGIHLADVGERL